MDLGIRGHVAVITGASTGIGRAIAQEFLLAGAHVAICSHSKAKIKATAEELAMLGQVEYGCVDCTEDASIYAFAAKVQERFGRIDAWINNVGAVVSRTGKEFTASDVDKAVDICFKSTLFGAQAAFRHMRKNGGAIVNISSLAARCPSAGMSTLYGPMKAAVNNLTLTLAGEYAAWNVRVNCVMPGCTATETAMESLTDAALEYNIHNTLLQRIAEPSEIAKPVVFLASPAASFITAESLEVSGGRARTLNPQFSAEMRNLEHE